MFIYNKSLGRSASFPSNARQSRQAPVAGRDQIPLSPPPSHRSGREEDGRVKERAKELKNLKGAVMKGVKVVGDSCKRAWNKVKSIKR
uniref:Uncharacterized protein n=1 Tax=Oryza punctata TaxID=4537 RepID=A0A0E0KT46_ORYPU